MNHGNRSMHRPRNNPSPEEVRAGRLAKGLTQSQAAEIVRGRLHTWQQWEAGDRSMHPGLWELFLLKTGQWT